MTSRPSDPGVVNLLPPDWKSHFFLFSLTSVYSVLLKKINCKSMFFCSCVGPCAKEAKSCQTQGNNYNLFASQLASLDFRTCENWVDINGIPIQEEKQLTSGWEDVLYSEESKTFALEIRISLLRVGSTGILKVWERTLVILPPEAYNLAMGSKQDWNFKLLSTLQSSLKVNTIAQISRRPSSLVTTPLAKRFQIFVSKEILKRLTTGALGVWGRAGDLSAFQT